MFNPLRIIQLYKLLTVPNSECWYCIEGHWFPEVVTQRKLQNEFNSLRKNRVHFFVLSRYFYLRGLSNKVRRVLKKRGIV